jgi:hypothetical protein
VRSIFVEEIDTFGQVLNFQDFIVGVVFKDELFKEEEGLLVVNLLSNLDESTPSMWSIFFLTILALLVKDNEFNRESLLDGDVINNFLLNSQLNLNSSRVRFSPDETGIKKLNLVQSSDSSKTQGQKFFRFKFSMNPWRSEVSFAGSAEVENSLLGNTTSNISVTTNTLETDVGACRSRRERAAASTTQDSDLTVKHGVIHELILWFNHFHSNN